MNGNPGFLDDAILAPKGARAFEWPPPKAATS